MADDQSKTRDQLLAELQKARQRIAELESASARVVDRESSARNSTGPMEQSQEWFKALFELAPDAILISDLDDRIVEVNEAACRMLGYSREELLRLSIPDIQAAEQRGIPGTVIRSELESGQTFESLDLHKNGHPIPVEVMTKHIRISGRQLGLSIVRDISERKDAERALLEYAHVVQATKDFMAVLDEERRYAMVNESLLLSRGLRRDEVIGRFIWDVVGRDLYEASLRKPLDLCYQGQGQQIEVEFEFPAQGLRDLEIKLSPVLDSSGRVVRVAAVSSDISDRKKSEEALRRSEEKYRTILENMDEAYFELDLGGNLTFFNEALRKNLGYSREELLGMNNREYTRPESWKRMFDIFQNIYLTGEPARITDYEVEAKDGRVIVAEASAHLMRDEKGAPVGFRGLARDVTERKKSEQERQQLEAQLIQAQKMEAVGTLAGGIAHDFNNILQSLKGNIQLWLRKMDESDPGHKYLERMNTMTDRATELVRGLLTFSRTSSPQDLKPVDLNLLIAETVEILKRTVPKMITIHTRLNAEMSCIHGESTQLQQVLMNLVSNARDAMAPQESGNIWIESDNVSSGGQKGVKGLPSGDYIRIKVSDSGVGMDQKILEHIFEPFFSTKDVGQGTGLGLAMVYGIVQTHEGWIDCTSQEGVGTEFTILLPLTSTHSRSGQWHASGAGHPTALKGQIQQRPKSVLLVDDEAPVRDVTREWLEEKGFQVSTVKSGEEALDQVERNPQDFDVVLLDLNMPGMGGEAALKVLLRINPQLKIIVVSGYSGHTVSDDPPGTGAAAFLVKPFTLEELSASINQVLGD